MASMEKYLFSTKEEFIAYDQIAGPPYVLNLSAHIIVIVLCLFLFLIY
jgi:hypothetical protein